MPGNLFLQNVIAVIWDFDKTLIPGHMQEPLFRRYGVNPREFWVEVNNLAEYYGEVEGIQVNRDTIYLNHLLTYVHEGRMPGLTNAVLRECGAEIEFFPGMPEFFDNLAHEIEDYHAFKRQDIRVEHYIVSTGLRQMILGSKIAPYVEGVWGCEFVERPAASRFMKTGLQHGMSIIEANKAGRRARPGGKGTGCITQVAYAIDNTTKTRAIFEINKGSNIENIDVNALIKHEDRCVPFQNMLYIADGPSDVPVFSILNQQGGHTYGVYGRDSRVQFNQVKRLQEQGRIQSFSEADYQQGSQAYLWITETVREIAWRIVRNRQHAFTERISPPPVHLSEDEIDETEPHALQQETRRGSA